MRVMALALIGLAVLPSLALAQMTGPIDTGTIRTERLQLNSFQFAQATPAPGRAPAAPAPRATQNLDIKAFAGSFAGSGIADGEDATYYGVTQRDLDVRITPAADGGFTIIWTTVLRQGGEAQNPIVRRRATTMTFVPGPRQGMFRATDSGDALKGEMVSWARIARNTLTLYQFTILPDGRHEVQTYARTVSGSGMDLVYTRVADGERQRRVRGKLVKNAN
jgi:hypothetical protein